MKYKFSVFTPCYNSENIIERLFDSLQNQILKDFEWIVVDDCSKDNTVEVLEKLILKAKFPVKFIKNEKNLMETKNIEIGLKNAEGYFFVRLSHDDMLVPEALENYKNAWESLSEDEKPNFVGVICNCLDKDLKLEGTKFPKDLWKSDDFEMRFKYKIKGEKCSAQRTDILRKYPFDYPEVDEYVPASLHYFTVSYYYKQLYSNNFATIHIVNDGKHQHMEQIIKKERRYSAGHAFYFENVVNKFYKKIWPFDKLSFLFFMTNVVRYNRYDEKSYCEIVRKIKVKKWIVPLSILLGNLNELYRYKKFL